MSSNKMNYDTSIVIFTRDLRVNDNYMLHDALKCSKNILPIFVFTPAQIDNNKRFNDNCFQFMFESLKELNKKIPLHFFHDDLLTVVTRLKKHNQKIDAVFISGDYTPFAKKRERDLQLLCKKLGMLINIVKNNHTLLDFNSLKNSTGETYKMFTPFFIKAYETIKSQTKNIFPITVSASIIKNKCVTTKQQSSIKLSEMEDYFEYNDDIAQHGGRSNAIQLLKKLNPICKRYEKTKKMPSVNTTQLSAHNKFGTVSIREVYFVFITCKNKAISLLEQLFWREFYYYLLENNQKSLTQNFNKKWNKFPWQFNRYYYERWKMGRTGFPMVDAAMRELNATGYIHNRSRMIAAMFLTKNLNISWKYGDYYFSKKLTDYDPAQNAGNWQWVAGSGVDPLRYGMPRVMDPWRQQKKQDPECIYVKKWIPELKNIPNKSIKNWNTDHHNFPNVYIKPMIDYDSTIERFKKRFRHMTKY
jgi:deoxyribodipyrimidine photo-lyase